MKTIEAYQLHDAKTEEILGTVFIEKTCENASDEIFEGWARYNRENDASEDITKFVEWFNENYETKLGTVNMEFIQP